MVDLRYEIDNSNPAEKKRFIRRMFDSISPSYDSLNGILSLGIDGLWRRSAVHSLGSIEGSLVLDLCCGTGDMSWLLRRKGARVVSVDFSAAMIARGIANNNIEGGAVIADACMLPFREESFDAMTIAFGVRNIPDIERFITEARRVLRPGGMLEILELTRPGTAILGFAYRIYLSLIVPVIGGLISGRRVAYRYLSETISTFIEPGRLAALLSQHGFTTESRRRHTFGVATTILCRRGLRAGAH
jgi:demethylmenaquinone methyltransferase/2-methoxy-6-polyprenyl-1,4-benzoquinol methylase